MTRQGTQTPGQILEQKPEQKLIVFHYDSTVMTKLVTN